MPKEKRRLLALKICILAGAGALVLHALADSFALPLSPSHDSFTAQIGAIGGLVSSLLVAKQVHRPSVVFVVAAVGLCIGAWAPWLHQMAPNPETFLGALTAGLDSAIAPGAFSFGTSFLVKAVEAEEGPDET